MHGAASQDSYDVEGLSLTRPFTVRRLGHFGINVESVDVALDFYNRLLGFDISDDIDFGARIPEVKRAEIRETRGLFLRNGTDHHSFVLFPRQAVEASNPHYAPYPELLVNQITWQVASLQQVVDGFEWFRRLDHKILRSGRDTPGSNWHIYPSDPDGHVNEIYYGIEQIGWAGLSKPMAMHEIRYMQPPVLPHKSEFAEINEALAKGHSLLGGFRRQAQWPETFNVGGVLLARPFKVQKVGPVRIFVDDVDAALEFYQHALGLTLTEEVIYQGHRCLFLRANTEHHSLAIYPRNLRVTLGLAEGSSLLGFGLQVGSYRQLRDAIAFLEDNGVRFEQLPQELSPGIGHHAWAIDADGNRVQLYWEMEQIGWDGKPRPANLRRRWHAAPATWPDAIDAQSDSFMGEVFLGPFN